MTDYKPLNNKKVESLITPLLGSLPFGCFDYTIAMTRPNSVLIIIIIVLLLKSQYTVQVALRPP